MPEHRLTIPERTRTSRIEYRVPFYDTDAMGVVHHANYVRYLELSRVGFLREHDEPYQHYVAQGYHVVVTRVDIRLRQPSRFDDLLAVTCWLERVRNASLTFGYQIQCGRRADLDRAHRARRGQHARQGRAHAARSPRAPARMVTPRLTLRVAQPLPGNT